MEKKIFIITGEHSGDKHASNVVRELKALNPNYIIEAIGGQNLVEQGVKLFSSHKKMSAIGFSLKIIADHFTLGTRLVKYLKEEFKPDLILLVDYGAFNLAVSKPLKLAGFKIFYFIPPQIWASRKWRLKTVKQNIDKVLTIFPFERNLYSSVKIQNKFVGHPLIGELAPKANREEFFTKHGLDKNKKLISIFPGSRIFEIKQLLKIFEKTITLIEKVRPDVQFVISHAPNLADDAFKTKYKQIKGENQALLSVSDALILASGTVALEAALYKTPMVIAYRGPVLFYLIYLAVRSIKKACLVNIITNKDIVPEFLMFDCEPEKISKSIIEILDNPQKQIEQLGEIEQLLGKKHCAVEVANIINKELEKNG